MKSLILYSFLWSWVSKNIKKFKDIVKYKKIM